MLTTLRADARADLYHDLADEAFSPFDFSGGALVAISGGGDSTALLFLLKDYFDRHALRLPLLAVTVDHALRAESAAEATDVSDLCARHGIRHRTLVWRGDKPSTGLPAAAREARYGLLAKAARQAGIGTIVTGHTADDQAETVSMRQLRVQAAKRGRERGLAGMAPATLYDWSVWIVRPLLGIRRQTLRDYLAWRGVGWVEDPTNIDNHYERPRIRASLTESAAAFHFEASMASAKAAATLREAAGRQAATLIERFASQPSSGLTRLDPAFADGERNACVTAMRMLLATVGGTTFPPDEARTAALVGRLRTPGLCATLSRTVIDVRRTGIFLRRELRDLPAASLVSDGMIWDGRRRINFRDAPASLVIEPQGDLTTTEHSVPQNRAPGSLVRAATAAEPASRPDPAGSKPSLQNPAQVEVLPLVAPFARFLPSFDLDLAVALANLVGAPALPAPPAAGLRYRNQAGKA